MVRRQLKYVDQLIMLNSFAMALWLPMPGPNENFYWSISCLALGLNCLHAFACLLAMARADRLI
jgi:hypothetical protein